jgi:hypothetical protein
MPFSITDFHLFPVLVLSWGSAVGGRRGETHPDGDQQSEEHGEETAQGEEGLTSSH